MNLTCTALGSFSVSEYPKTKNHISPIRNNPQAVYPIASHETFEAFFFPHPNQASPYAFILGIGMARLNLSDNRRVNNW